MSRNHSPHTLHAWPRALLARRIALCSSWRSKVQEKASLINKFRDQGFPESVLQTLSSVPLAGPAVTLGGSSEHKQQKCKYMCLCLPFHPRLVGAPRVLRELEGLHVLSEIWPDLKVQISWSNKLHSILKLVQGTFGERLGLVGENNK